MANKNTSDTSINLLNIPGKVLKYLTLIYLMSTFIILPFAHKAKYVGLGEAKFNYFKYTTITFVIIMAVVSVFWMILNIYNLNIKTFLKTLTITDKFIFFYSIAVLLSYILSDYKSMALWGHPGWSMGLITQMLLILIYFFTSRFLTWNRIILWIILVPSAIVFLLGVLHRFKMDPYGYYIGLNEAQQLLFLSTIGQATWYSSYLCVTLPIGMFLFWHDKQTEYHNLIGSYCAIGFASLVTQNSDSAFIGIGLVFVMLFCNSFSSNQQFKRFLELVILCLASMRVIGVLQLTFPESVPALEALSIFFSQNILLWFVLAIIVLFYIFFLKMDKEQKIDIMHWKWVRLLVLILCLLGVIGMITLIVLTTSGNLPAQLDFLKGTQYFQFDDKWGNGRGFTWKYACSMFHEYSLKLKLFGCGPDSFADYSYPLHEDILRAQWGNAILANAHNEWLNALVTLGIVGFLSYIGIFISSIVYFIKHSKNFPLLLAISGCILSYMGHNLFCYQQVICTPLIFILIGIGINYKNNFRIS